MPEQSTQQKKSGVQYVVVRDGEPVSEWYPGTEKVAKNQPVDAGGIVLNCIGAILLLFSVSFFSGAIAVGNDGQKLMDGPVRTMMKEGTNDIDLSIMAQPLIQFSMAEIAKTDSYLNYALYFGVLGFSCLALKQLRDIKLAVE